MSSVHQQKLDVFLTRKQLTYVRSLCKQYNLTYSSFFRLIMDEIMSTMERAEIGLILATSTAFRYYNYVKEED